MQKNSCVLVISDTHIPYHHIDMLRFLEAVNTTYKPDRIIHIGDEVDNHAVSYHESDPDLYSAGRELAIARLVVQDLESLFPKMDLLESNHGSLYYRKAMSAGIPRAAIKPYNELLGVGRGWKWHFDLTLPLPGGRSVYFHHGKSQDVLKLSQSMSMNAVQGHYHSRFKVDYWGNPNGLYWGMQVGCLIDDKSYAFAYNKTTLARPIIGCGIILDGQAKLLPLVKDRHGRWDGKVY